MDKYNCPTSVSPFTTGGMIAHLEMAIEGLSLWAKVPGSKRWAKKGIKDMEAALSFWREQAEKEQKGDGQG